MPNKETVKTKSARKIRPLIGCFLAAALVLTGVWFVVTRHQPAVQSGAPASETTAKPTLRVGVKTYKLEVADTDSERTRGLGYRDRLAKNAGMLFIYSQPDNYCFWMKGMRFALDMVWLDADHKVVYIKQNATPDSYPQTFCPDANAVYIIELNAGETANANIAVGHTLQF